MELKVPLVVKVVIFSVSNGLTQLSTLLVLVLAHIKIV